MIRLGMKLTGPEAIELALSKINLDDVEAEARDVIQAKKKTARPRAVRLLRIVSGLRKNQMSPTKFMLRSVPVIPPQFRPFSVTGSTFLPGDANELYRDVMEYRRLYTDTEKAFGTEAAAPAYNDLAASVRAAYGYGESPNPKIKSRAVKGFLETVTGASPKTSFFQSRMLSKPVDTVGGGVIIPDAEYGMDDVGLPEEMAWPLFSRHVQRRMVLGGLSPSAALKHLKDRTPQARKALTQEMSERPVVVTRSPAWHRTNVVGQYARLVDGDAVRINTFISEGTNADFNGDAMIGKILVLAEKNSEAENLFSSLRCGCPCAMVVSMFAKKTIPLFGVNDFSLFLCDLEDFPKGDKLGENKNGKNGHIDFYKVPDGTLALSFDEVAGDVRWVPAYGISVHPDREIELAHLGNGRQIITDDDPRAVYGMDPATGLMCRDTPSNAHKRRLAVPCSRDLATACAGLDSVVSLPIGGVDVPLGFDFGYLMGALCGDGWWDKRSYGARSSRAVYLADLGGFVAAKVGGVIRDLFGDVTYSAREFKASEIAGRYGDTVKHKYAGRAGNLDEFTEFCSRWMGGHGDDSTSGSGNKKLPDFFLMAPMEFRRGLLTGLVDTDGTCSVTLGKGTPQLQCAVTTTSVRLAADIKFLALTLGVHASVSFSKTTTRGNSSWLCGLSSVGLRERDLLRDLRNPDKLNNFANTPVVGDNTSLVHNKVVVPDSIFDIVMNDMTNPKIRSHERGGDSVDLKARMEAQNMYTQWSKAKRDKVVSRPGARNVIEYLRRRHLDREAAYGAAVALLRQDRVVMTPENVNVLRAGIYATTAPFSVDRDKTSEAFKLLCIVKSCRVGEPMGKRRQGRLRDRLGALIVYVGACGSDELHRWVRDYLERDHITWTTVTEVEKTGQRETGYDLTVPGYETFMSADGVILSNTMSVHVMATKEAVDDVKNKLMASKMQFSIKDRSKTMGNPKHEDIIGLTMGQMPGGTKRTFSSEKEAMDAINSGQVDLNDDIEIGSPNGISDNRGMD